VFIAVGGWSCWAVVAVGAWWVMGGRRRWFKVVVGPRRH